MSPAGHDPTGLKGIGKIYFIYVGTVTYIYLIMQEILFF